MEVAYNGIQCTVLQCVAVCCRLMHCGAVGHTPCQGDLQMEVVHTVVWCSVLQCVAAYCSVLRCVAVCCNMLQCVAACVAAYPHHIQYSDVYCACVAVCHSVLQCDVV